MAYFLNIVVIQNSKNIHIEIRNPILRSISISKVVPLLGHKGLE
jgi:hypothetical protein